MGESDLTVLKDPGAAGTAGDLAAQMETLRGLRALIEEAVEMVNAAEWSRRQLEDLGTAWRELRASGSGNGPEGRVEGADESLPEPAATLPDALAALDEKLAALEGIFFDLRLTGAYQDSLRWKRLLYAQLTRLAWTISRTDLPPTESQLAVLASSRAELGAGARHLAAAARRGDPGVQPAGGRAGRRGGDSRGGRLRRTVSRVSR